MSETNSSPIDAIKDMIGKTDIKDSISHMTDKVMDSVKNIDIEETVADVKKSYSHGGIKEATATVGDKIKEVAGKAVSSIKQDLTDYPGAAVDCADRDDVTSRLVKEDVRSLNNNPRNSDM